jgi:DNA-binding transcriptional MerR regulator
MPAADKRYRIGEVAEATGLTPDTLRFYERRRLIDRPARSSGRFRIYDVSVLDRIAFIKRAQALGFSLDDIHELIVFNGKGGIRRCARVRELLRDRLEKLEVMLVELTDLRETLRTALRRCERAIETGDAAACPVIELENPQDRGESA